MNYLTSGGRTHVIRSLSVIGQGSVFFCCFFMSCFNEKNVFQNGMNASEGTTRQFMFLSEMRCILPKVSGIISLTVSFNCFRNHK